MVKDPLFNDKNANAVRMLDSIYRQQTEIFMPFELLALYMTDGWLDAENVLDIGTGNGYYLRCLANRFPQKNYLGVDKSSEMIAIAQNENTNKNVKFLLSEFDSITGIYDFIIYRFTAQHIGNIDHLLKRSSELTKPGGLILVIDGNDEYRLCRPSAPGLIMLYAALQKQRKSIGANRDAIRVLDNLVEGHKEIKEVRRWDLIIPSTVGDNLWRLWKLEASTIEFLSEVKVMEYDYDRAAKEWKQWYDHGNAYIQNGLRLRLLERQ